VSASLQGQLFTVLARKLQITDLDKYCTDSSFNIVSISRWPQLVFWNAQHICSHHHVFVLPARSSGTTLPEIYLVEEVPDCSSDGRNTTLGSSSHVYSN
jgi:hypothetical protein